MNLHQVAPTQTRFVRAPITDVVQYDYCEWNTWVVGTECQNLMAHAIVDTKYPEEGFHGVAGSCVGHLCDKHIDEAFAETTKDPA